MSVVAALLSESMRDLTSCVAFCSVSLRMMLAEPENWSGKYLTRRAHIVEEKLVVDEPSESLSKLACALLHSASTSPSSLSSALRRRIFVDIGGISFSTAAARCLLMSTARLS